MMYTRIFTLVVLLINLNLTLLSAQNDHLKGLTKVDLLQMPDVNIEPDKYPVYNTFGQKLTDVQVLQAMMSQKYLPDLYVDNNGDIKAIVLRPVSIEENISLKPIPEEIDNNSESFDALVKAMANPNLVEGSSAPDFEITDINGKKYSLQSLKGKVIVMNFWFTDCKPCKVEIPELNTLVEKYSAEDVVFLGFALDDNSKLDPFLEKTEFKYTMFPNSKNVADSYKISGYPTHVVIDKDSKIAFSTVSYSAITTLIIERNINKLLGKE
ncbi:redoxin domain-containing protein [Winogradskyella sp. 3972H.M.0a.05]|uniref:TlpA family protein disulfide reductase n=1 Tax=Winogradskyella sp. 3972H.M.0a.05 TaxID=2950277 RepID=UPI0033946629